jgi:hypothetical protein
MKPILQFTAVALLFGIGASMRSFGGPPKEPELPAKLSVKQLLPMYVSKKLFTPNKWWVYEGHDEDRPATFGVEQSGKVSLGDRFTPNHGALITYAVQVLPNVKAASKTYKIFTRLPARGKNTRLIIQPVHAGEEGFQYSILTLNNHHQGTSFDQGMIVRTGRYVVMLTGRADLKAFGPRPKSGNRQWMCEPVFNTLRAAILDKWKNYRSLLAEK